MSDRKELEGLVKLFAIFGIKGTLIKGFTLEKLAQAILDAGYGKAEDFYIDIDDTGGKYIIKRKESDNE